MNDTNEGSTPLPIDCEEAIRRLAIYLDQELDAEAAAEVEAHLERCRSCFSRAEFERRLRERLRRELGDVPVNPEFQERVRDLIRGLASGANPSTTPDP
jgi:anti-sigma factor (TIGR02949 family)